MMEYNVNEIVIGQPVSPCKKISIDESNGHDVLVSHGGGMGGASYHYYSRDVRKKAGNYLVKIITVDNRHIDLTDRFIVSIEPVRFVEVKWDTTLHANYKRKVCDKEVTRIIFAFRGNEYCAFNDKEMQGCFDRQNGSKIDKWIVFKEQIKE
jgi:hypothetical protein